MKISDIKMASHDGINNLKLKNSSEIKDEKDLKLEEASKQLEGQFLTFMVQAMEKTIDKEKGDNNLAGMMFSTTMGKAMSENGGIGLADFIYKSLKENGVRPENIAALFKDYL